MYKGVTLNRKKNKKKTRFLLLFASVNKNLQTTAGIC